MAADDRLMAEPPLFALLQRGVRWSSDEFVKRLTAAGVGAITPAHGTVLAHLDADTALSIAELARRADVTRQTMHRAVTQLIDEGLLASAPGPGFPRSTLISLTAAGCRRREVAVEIFHDLEQELSERLGAETLAQLRQTLTKAWPR
ncbi:MarR family winged helix-turn-helix transcriptional regulator [Microlunatus soli]|uniref:DNA-binding transcriptional regulator, MarR family n=1 Tax=Microlunatus soli TaxID=630515 RepID=A0A1H1TZZ3_9ACTN|nr:MarR family winged helix-turn-helix transcriptional regulator [Microlunatus soli]SDS65875.1 DNA-binding transcriptional regulator, MarR family [Microlunatus soli]